MDGFDQRRLERGRDAWLICARRAAWQLHAELAPAKAKPVVISAPPGESYESSGYLQRLFEAWHDQDESATMPQIPLYRTSAGRWLYLWPWDGTSLNGNPRYTAKEWRSVAAEFEQYVAQVVGWWAEQIGKLAAGDEQPETPTQRIAWELFQLELRDGVNEKRRSDFVDRHNRKQPSNKTKVKRASVVAQIARYRKKIQPSLSSRP